MSDPRFLTLAIRIHGGRFHGMQDRDDDEWPPAPARVFQALVAAASRGVHIPIAEREALRWLESLDPPTIGAPKMRRGQRVEMFVPNNDLDAVQGIPDRVAEIRSAKQVAPKIFDEEVPLLYSWQLHDDSPFISAIQNIAGGLYQLGRGIDQAWAQSAIDDAAALSRRFASYAGTLYAPGPGDEGTVLNVPAPGSLASLEARHAATTTRFSGASHAQLFSQPPKPRFRPVAYDVRGVRFLFDLQRSNGAFASLPAERAAWLVALARDLAAERLAAAIPDHRENVEQCLTARGSAPDASRVVVLALPSIGHEHADRGLRRIVVVIPPGCPLRVDDLQWAFSGLELYEPATGVVLDRTLVPTNDDSMLQHFGFDGSARRWRTVTPADLGGDAKRRRIEPSRAREEAKPGSERLAEETRAADAVARALAQAGIWTPIDEVRVQREPFARRGVRAEAFAEGSFEKERLWHVEIGFVTPVKGPLAIGGGRFTGLGLMAPVRRADRVFAFIVESGLQAMAPEQIARALRRAVMARVQAVIGRAALSAYLSGHKENGTRTNQVHVHYAFDPISCRLFVIAPRLIRDGEDVSGVDVSILRRALVDFDDLRAGAAGRLRLRSAIVDQERDPLFAPSRVWASVTPYHVNRHGRGGAVEAVRTDVLADCRRAELPKPEVDVRDVRGVPGVGLIGHIRLRFTVPVRGPLLLGRSRFLGGGLLVGRH